MGQKEMAQKAAAANLALARQAEAEGRDFTPEEQSLVDANMKRVKAYEADRELTKQLEELNSIAMGYTTRNAPERGPWAKALRNTQSMGSKALMSPSGSVGVPSPLSILAPLGDRVDTILQLIPVEPIGSDAYAFLRETVRTHNAAPVATEGVKPTSVYTVEKIDRTAQTIAHLTQPIPRTYLADAPLLDRYLDTVLREGLQLELEAQIIAGDGEGANLEGLLEVSGALTQPFVTDVFATCRKAVTALQLRSITPTAWVFHPSDWEEIELTKDLEGRYYYEGPSRQAGEAVAPLDLQRRRLWGYPVALSLGQDEGTAVLADFAGSTQIWEREQTRIDWSENVYDGVTGKTDFERNLIRFRAEGRWGFACTRPSGICIVALSAS